MPTVTEEINQAEIQLSENAGAPQDADVLKIEIQNFIENLLSDNEVGVEAYISLKNNGGMKRFEMDRGTPNDRNNEEQNFHLKMQNAIAEAIKSKFLGDETEFDTVYNVADNQKKFYIIEQNENYQPFAATQLAVEQLDELPSYQAAERENAEGIFFCFRRDENTLWAYQHLYQNAIPNRKGNGFHIFQHDEVFTEFKKPLLLVSRRVDILIMGSKIITDDTRLLQRSFQFEDFVKKSATQVVKDIQRLEFVSNAGKVMEYIGRSKPVYARKMMRIKDSKVLQMPKEKLYEKIMTLPRWQGKFDVDKETQRINLKTFTQVECLIDLFDERYTRSDVTGEEYDTGAKKWVSPV